MAEVRVRIAPSPTGPMHVGTAYQAVFNKVWARQNEGQFVLRIEDTDQARSHKKYEDELMESLWWLGLRWDEGPDVGGPYGPYRQSERLSIYAEYAAKLVASGHAYPCFCTSERLAALRKEQQERKEHVGYDGHCRGLAAKEVEAKIQAGCAHVIRLKMPREGACEVEDMLREPISLEWGNMDDQVLMKSDGFPTYHLAVVVDDHLMRISHVIRGRSGSPPRPSTSGCTRLLAGRRRRTCTCRCCSIPMAPRCRSGGIRPRWSTIAALVMCRRPCSTTWR